MSIVILTGKKRGGGGGTGGGRVDSVTIVTPVPASLEPTQTFDLEALVIGSGPITDLAVEWLTSNASIATVVSTGNLTATVTAVANGTATITATLRSKSDQVLINVVASAPAVDSVTVSPSTITAGIGVQTPVQAVVRAADNTVLTEKTVTWLSSDVTKAIVSADSGDESHTARVTGVAAGSAAINAFCEGVTSNNVSVTVSAPSTEFPNEPPGYEVIVRKDFATLPPTSEPNQVGIWGKHTNTPELAQVTNEGRSTARMLYRIGLLGGQAPSARFWGWKNWVAPTDRDYREIYCSTTLKVGDVDFQNQAVGTKLFYIAYGGTENNNQFFFLLRNGTGGIAIQSSIRLEVQTRTAYYPPGHPNPTGDWQTTYFMPTGQYVQLELQMILNTDGVSNGIIRVWADGVFVFEVLNAVFINSSANALTGFREINVTPVWGGVGGTRTREDYMYWDKIYISGIPYDPSAPPPVLPPPTTHPNQPVGFEPVSETQCQTLPPDAVNGQWGRTASSRLTSHSGDPIEPLSPSTYIRHHYPNLWPSGDAPVNWWGWHADSLNKEYQKAYVHYTFMIEGPNYENQAVGTKLCFLGCGRDPASTAKNDLYWLLRNGTGAQAIQTAMKVELIQQNVTSRVITQNVDTNPLVVCGSWIHFELLFEINDIGSANGIFKAWVNGTLTHNYSNVTYRTVAHPHGIAQIKFNPTWGGVGGTKTRDDYHRVGHVFISGVPL